MGKKEKAETDQCPLDSGKGKEMDSLPKASGGDATLPTPGF